MPAKQKKLKEIISIKATSKKNNNAYQNSSDAVSTVKESAIAYGNKFSTYKAGLVAHKGGVSSPAFKKHIAILADAAHKPESQMTSLEKMNVARFGVSKKDLESLKTKTKLDYNRLAKALSVTRVTLINKKKQEKFNATLSERIIGLADIYSYGYEVFEDEERFNQWMLKPNQALSGKTPFELIDNQFGREEIRNIIGRIDYGVYS